MGKKLKPSKDSVLGTEPELLSLKKEKVTKGKIIDNTEKGSVFGNLSIPKEPTIQPKVEEKVLKGLEDKIIVQEEPKVKVVVPPIIPETIVYEISYMEAQKEQVVYSRNLPVIKDNYLLVLDNAFGRSNLREVVLGRREIKISCMLPLKTPNLTIDMRGGTFIKVVAEQDWMEREYEETKKMFDEAVLKAYREMAAKGLTDLGIQPVKGVVPVPPQETEEEEFPVGNITPNKNIAMKPL